MATYFVTGATGGIGGAIATALHERGHDLIVAGHSPDRLAEVCGRLPRARPVAVDLSRPETLADVLPDEMPQELAGVVHSAGVIQLGPIADTGWAVWQDTLTVNLAAPAELTRLLLPALRRARGHVVFVNSGSGLRAAAHWASYAASKYGLRALADSLREEEAANGIRVTTVYPGRTATAMQRRVREQEGGAYEPGNYVPAEAVAAATLAALDAPRGTEIGNLTVRPTTA